MASSSPAPFRRLSQLLAGERDQIGLVFFYATLAGLLGLSVPLGVQAIIGLVSGGLLLQPVIILIGLVVAGTFAAGAVQVVQMGVVERIQQRLFARYALELAGDLPRADTAEVAGAELAERTNRFFEVITIQKSLAKLLTESVAALLAILAGLLLLTFYNTLLALFGGALLAILAVLLFVTGRRGLTTSLDESTAKYRVAHWLQELARHATSFRIVGETRMPVQRMDREVDDYLSNREAHFRVLVRQSFAVVAMKTLVTGGLLIIGSSLVINRKLTLGQFVASELVIVTVLSSVEKLIFSLSTVYDALTAAEKLAYLRDLPLVPRNEPGANMGLAVRTADMGQRGIRVHIDDLTYRYPRSLDDAPVLEPVLHDLSLQVRAGERLALVGSEGAGATTLLRTIAGLNGGYQGTLTLDGTSMRDLPVSWVHAQVALVEAEGTLFDGTLEENVVMGRSGITSRDVAEAAEVAGLNPYVHGLVDGWQTRVGAGGVIVPSNVARKVLLARAVAGNPRLLLFDEFFHHVEPAAKGPLTARLCDAESGWTIVAASHDPVFLAACDRVVLLDEGRIIDEGTFDVLRSELVARELLRTEPRMRSRAGDAS